VRQIWDKEGRGEFDREENFGIVKEGKKCLKNGIEKSSNF